MVHESVGTYVCEDGLLVICPVYSGCVKIVVGWTSISGICCVHWMD